MPCKRSLARPLLLILSATSLGSWLVLHHRASIPDGGSTAPPPFGLAARRDHLKTIAREQNGWTKFIVNFSWKLTSYQASPCFWFSSATIIALRQEIGARLAIRQQQQQQQQQQQEEEWQKQQKRVGALGVAAAPPAEPFTETVYGGEDGGSGTGDDGGAALAFFARVEAAATPAVVKGAPRSPPFAAAAATLHRPPTTDDAAGNTPPWAARPPEGAAAMDGPVAGASAAAEAIVPPQATRVSPFSLSRASTAFREHHIKPSEWLVYLRIQKTGE